MGMGSSFVKLFGYNTLIVTQSGRAVKRRFWEKGEFLP